MVNNYFNKLRNLFKTPPRKLTARWVIDDDGLKKYLAELQKYMTYHGLQDHLTITDEGPTEDLFIKIDTPISGCLPYDDQEVGPTGSTRLVRTENRDCYWLVDTETTTHDWHFNGYYSVWWIDAYGHEELSNEFVFVPLPNDPVFKGFVVKESLIF